LHELTALDDWVVGSNMAGVYYDTSQLPKWPYYPNLMFKLTGFSTEILVGKLISESTSVVLISYKDSAVWL